jgi:hypothetical protein
MMLGCEMGTVARSRECLVHGRGGGEWGFVWVVRVQLIVVIRFFRQVRLAYPGSRF